MLRTDPSSIPRMMSRRDGSANAERITIVFDPQLDRRTGVGFGVSSAGVRSDFRHTQDEEMRGRESQFDPVWAAAAHVDSVGWTAELRIPFSQLRFPARETQRWGLQVSRWIPDRNEDLFWVMVPPIETGYISRFGTLEGIAGVKAARPVEFLPYVAGDATRRATTATENPLARPNTARTPTSRAPRSGSRTSRRPRATPARRGESSPSSLRPAALASSRPGGSVRCMPRSAMWTRRSGGSRSRSPRRRRG